MIIAGMTYLHANKLRPPLLLCACLHHRKLIRPHTTGTEIVHLSHLHQIMKSLHRLLNRCVRIKAMDLQEIHIVRIKPLQRLVNRRKDSISRKASAIDIVFGLGDLLSINDATYVWCFTHIAVAFAQDYEFVTRDVVLFHCFANDFFADAVAVDLMDTSY